MPEYTLWVNDAWEILELKDDAAAAEALRDMITNEIDAGWQRTTEQDREDLIDDYGEEDDDGAG
tara:strand:- start:288 stop:479 length:192 start_codon:yes stop_codon:yes gene_type:complete